MTDAILTYDLDTGWSSFYMYKKPSGKLYFGPAWDFDFTSSEYYLALMQKPVFVDFVRARYLTLSEQLPFHLEDLFIITQIHHPSFQRDGERWFLLSNWQQEQNMVKAWLRNRHQWFLEWTTTLT